MEKLTAKWIWATDDFVHMLYRKLMSRRRYRDAVVPTFWKIGHYYESVVFQKSFKIEKSVKVKINASGDINIYLDNNNYTKISKILEIPPGEHTLSISVYNENGLPCLFVESENDILCSNETWLVNCGDHKLVAVETNNKFVKEDFNPNNYKLDTHYEDFKYNTEINDGIMYDFCKETFGYLLFEEISGQGSINVSYGESREEAFDFAECETIDCFNISNETFAQTKITKAFRYVFVRINGNVDYKKLGVLVEDNDLVNKFVFESSDMLLNDIYDISLETMSLTSREFFLDGIKRDRWVWSGDSYQSINMNFYSFFDKEIVKNTIIALGGKNQFDMHINTIMDYSFYWIMSIYDYFLYTADTSFISKMFPRIIEVIEFCLQRTNKNGFMVGKDNDWVFVDWAGIDNEGEVCVEQILLCQSLFVICKLGKTIGYEKSKEVFNYANKLKTKIFKTFWKDKKLGFIHNNKSNQNSSKVTRYAGIFAVLYEFLNAKQKDIIKNNVLLNENVQAITTPYMKFYELAALMELNETQTVLNYMRTYWGGMMDLGATTFWEMYDPTVSGKVHYEMYGRKYGKSLCHAWGATPLLILGKYICGIKPSKSGYEEFEAKPQLGDIKWVKAEIPTNEGFVRLRIDKYSCEIYSSNKKGKLILKEKTYDIQPNIQYNFKY